MILPSKLSIQWLRRQYINGGISPLQVVKAVIARAQAGDKMNIWITKPNMKLIKPYLDALKKRSLSKHKLWGIPFAIKDNIDLAGIPTTAACCAYSYTPKESAKAVKLLIAQGAIPIGKTNMDQFATGLVGTRSPYGEVCNALNPEYISGGSSSGSAVCVADGQAAFALGTDTAGSGRVPAMLNGIYGFKASINAWDMQGVVPACESLDCLSVFANSIDDCIEVDGLVRQNGKLFLQTPDCICLPKDELEFFGDFAQEYKNCWEEFKTNISETLRARGVEVKYVKNEIFRETAKLLYDGPYIAERWASLGGFISKNENEILPVTRKILESGKDKNFSAACLFDAFHKLQKYKKQVKEILKNAVLILPTAGGTFTRKQVAENPVGTNNKMGLYTNHCNLLNLAAFAVPYKKTKSGFPFGVTAFSLSDKESYLPFSAGIISELEKDVAFAVHGLHMNGMELNRDLKSLGAKFIKKTKTDKTYKLYALNTNPVKPGLVKVCSQGAQIETELWSLAQKDFAEFVSKADSPMSFGKIKLFDGSETFGFLCEPYAVKNAVEITSYGGWKSFYENEKRRSKK
ncbi:MAG: allophanate hydrolase [Endomicrobium sp.]|jgi:allophanate hydrolase|nr:allophanate hydrolase [Endomicrobium sp.]